MANSMPKKPGWNPKRKKSAKKEEPEIGIIGQRIADAGKAVEAQRRMYEQLGRLKMPGKSDKLGSMPAKPSQTLAGPRTALERMYQRLGPLKMPGKNQQGNISGTGKAKSKKGNRGKTS